MIIVKNIRVLKISLGFSRYAVRYFTPRTTYRPPSYNRYRHCKINLTDSSSIINSTSEKVSFQKIDVISESLKCSPLRALQLIDQRSSILLMSDNHLLNFGNYFYDKLTFSDIMNHPSIMTFKKGKSEQQYEVLKEIGMTNITAIHVLEYKQILRKNTATLIKKNLLPMETNPIENMLSILKWPKGKTLKRIKEILQQNDWEQIALQDIKEKVLLAYMAERLNCNVEDIKANIDKYHTIKKRPLIWTKKNIDCLIHELGFTPEELQTKMFILRTLPGTVMDILALPSIGLKPTKVAVRSSSRVLISKAKNILEIEEILREYNIKDAQIKNHFGIYALSPKTVRKRLEIISQNEFLESAKLSERYLQLISRFNCVNTRLEFLRNRGLNETVSLSCILATEIVFQERFNIYSRAKLHSKESLVFLGQILNKTESEMRIKLDNHPLKVKLNFANSVKIMQDLTEVGITHEQIWNSFLIVLYDRDEVLGVLKELETLPELQPYNEWKGHDFLLELVIYYLEKSKYFTGKGSFKDSKRPMEMQYDVPLIDREEEEFVFNM